MSARSNTTTMDGSNSARSLNTFNAYPDFAMKRSLMRDLEDMRKQQQLQQQKSTTPATNNQPKARTMAVDPLKSSRLCANLPSQKVVAPQPPTANPRATSSSSTSANFRYFIGINKGVL